MKPSIIGYIFADTELVYCTKCMDSIGLSIYLEDYKEIIENQIWFVDKIKPFCKECGRDISPLVISSYTEKRHELFIIFKESSYILEGTGFLAEYAYHWDTEKECSAKDPWAVSIRETGNTCTIMIMDSMEDWYRKKRFIESLINRAPTEEEIDDMMKKSFRRLVSERIKEKIDEIDEIDLSYENPPFVEDPFRLDEF